LHAGSGPNRRAVHQSFTDFTFLTGNWIGKMLNLKGEIDPAVAMDLCNRATLAFLQRHLGERPHRVQNHVQREFRTHVI